MVLVEPEPEATLPATTLEGPVGFCNGFELVGGALVPLVDLVRVGAFGFVKGFGTAAPPAPREVLRFTAVLEGCRGRLGLVAPTAGSFRG